MTVLEQYADIKNQIATLEQQLDVIRPEVERQVFDAEKNTIESSIGIFKMVYVPKWSYSDKLIGEEKLVKDKIKLMKKREELDGVAQKISDGGRLVFTPVKDK